MLTGGQAFTKIAVDHFNSFSPELDLKEAALFVNREMRLKATTFGWHLEDSAGLPGVSFAVAKVGEDRIEILQGGDCSTLWLVKSGKVWISQSQFYPIEQKLRATIAQLMRKHGGDRQEMWEEFLPILRDQKRNDVNVKYAILNGQYAVEKHWQKIVVPSQDIVLLILFTDGLVPFEYTKDIEDLALRIRDQWQEGKSLRSILQWTRSTERKKATESHVDESEATALLLEFA